MTFRKYLSEIAIDPEFMHLSKPTTGPRSSTKIMPNTNSFNIIPIKISYAAYDLFKRNMAPKFKLADDLLNRRGNGNSVAEVKASNEELINLKELAEFIASSRTGEERESALVAIQEIESKMHGIGA